MATVPKVTNLDVYVSGSVLTLNWQNNFSGASYYTEVLKSDDGTTYYYYDTQYGDDHGYDDYSVTANTRQYYIIRAYADGYDPSDSDPAYGGIYSDTATDTFTVTDSVTDEAQSGGDIIVDTITMSDSAVGGGSVTGVVAAAATITDTITVSDVVVEASPLRTDFGYYLCGESGGVYAYSSASTTDAGAAFAMSWPTKAVDFSDLDTGLLTRWKTIYGLTLYYHDITASAAVSIAISADGGATWTSVSATVGTAALVPKEQKFYAIITGQYFQFRIESASAMKILGMRVEFEPAGDYYVVA